ncbi:nitrous oxide reductase accessory protein NosL [Namhaeicola litoreus]|uniref:Nitrous oxide reductase accessory protein NosL n=1 Tax=Namhaeicola litoreus TaxID=1052145 RepID=A0ABW3Y0B9_9FLAO
MKSKNFLGLAICCLMLSCSVKPEPIEFGKESCHFCKMTIVDEQHAAQMVSKKGKQFKYDAIECMLNDLSESKNSDEMAIFLVSSYGESNLTDAQKATYLISKEIKSPMGAFLSAFQSKEMADKTLTEVDGQLYTWQEIREKYGIE